jgi:CheY-like chemotaxis protein
MPTVLIADRDVDTRMILKSVFRNERWTVFETPDAVTAQRIARDHPVDVLLVNYPMRLPSGVTLTRAIRSEPRLAALPIVNLTSDPSAETREDGMADGITHTVRKPFSAQALVDLIAALTGLAQH